MKIAFLIQKPAAILSNLDVPQAAWEHRLATFTVISQLVVTGAVLAWYWRYLPSAIPLWYSRPWGEARLASPYFLLLAPVTALVVYVLNRMLLTHIANDHPMFAKTLSLTSLLVSLLSVIIVIRIITLVS